MGVYVSQSDITPGYLEERHLVQLTQDSAGSDVVNTTVLAAVIAAAEGEVDGYLGVRYQLPLASVPQLVKTLTARIVVYRLHRRRPGTIGEDLEKDYQRAIKLLDRILEGTVTLGAQPEPGENPERIIQSSHEDPIFGRDNLGDF